MRSAGTSGVTAEDNVVSKSAKNAEAGRAAAILARIIAAGHAQFSPVALAIALTALVAAILFIAYDAMASLAEARLAAVASPPAGLWTTWAGVGERGAFVLMLVLCAAIFGVRRYGGANWFLRNRDVDLVDLLETIPFGVALWTTTGTLLACNAHYVARLHREGPTVSPGRSYMEAVKRLTRGGYIRLVRQDDARRVLELHREDGSCLMIDERPLSGGGFVTLVTDITERRRTDLLLSAVQEEQRLLARRYHEEKLKAEAASRAKTSFLAHLSHDIRTPLNHIIGFAEMIRHQTYGPLGDPRYMGYVENIKASGDRLLASFATILELAELEGGERVMRLDPIDVDALLGSVRRRFSAQAQRAGLVLASGAPCRARLTGDRFGLERMLGNLVENAIRFTPAGGRVTVAAYAAEDGVVLEVADTGIGMTEEQLGRLSQPFAFGDAAFTREHDGAGLGIAISRAIAELSGGRLAIDSNLALGTTVAISLPLPWVDAEEVRAAVA
jgi:two-component system, cell cycle sensor histidine kinase PleC